MRVILAGAMLIFSVSFQVYQMSPKRQYFFRRPELGEPSAGGTFSCTMGESPGWLGEGDSGLCSGGNGCATDLRLRLKRPAALYYGRVDLRCNQKTANNEEESLAKNAKQVK